MTTSSLRPAVQMLLVAAALRRGAVRGRLGGVPVTELMIIQSVEEDGDVSPGQLCNSLLQSLLLRPRGRERTHVRQVPPREPLHLRKPHTQVRGEPFCSGRATKDGALTSSADV